LAKYELSMALANNQQGGPHSKTACGEHAIRLRCVFLSIALMTGVGILATGCVPAVVFMTSAGGQIAAEQTLSAVGPHPDHRLKAYIEPPQCPFGEWDDAQIRKLDETFKVTCSGHGIKKGTRMPSVPFTARKELLRYHRSRLFGNTLILTASGRKDRTGSVTIELTHFPPNMFVESAESRRVCQAAWNELVGGLYDTFGERLNLGDARGKSH